MKDKSFKLQWYVIVPGIFAGFTALASILTYQLMQAPLGSRLSMPGSLLVAGVILVLTAFMTGSLVVNAMVRPLERFVERTRMMVPPNRSDPAQKPSTRNSMAPIVHTLDRVSEVLDNADAQAMFPDIVAPSSAMRAILALLLKIAPTDATVLILGESGTGKELVAKAIHTRSPRAERPFVAINCAGIPEGLLESELFGHEKGAFTGAYARKIGKFELAAGGTIFLDEIADMPMVTQAKILRALQEREIERVGGTQSVPINIRVIAATNKELTRLVEEGSFREDLFFRLDVFTVRLPPLRERSEDIPLIASEFLRRIKPSSTISPRALAALTAYAWPGNIRELRNVIEAAAALADAVIEPQHLRVSALGDGDLQLEAGAWANSGPQNLDQRLNAIEKAMILEALARTGGVQVRAADVLGIKERSLWHRIAKHQIDVASVRKSGATHEMPVIQ